jgi:hypothetical protein
MWQSFLSQVHLLYSPIVQPRMCSYISTTTHHKVLPLLLRLARWTLTMAHQGVVDQTKSKQ